MAVFSWGANSHGQLGLGFSNELCITPQQITRLPFNSSSICSIKGGGGHVLALDNCGQVYACGWNNRGQLGINCTEDKNEFSCVPNAYFNNTPVVRIACGWDTSGAITADKKAYVWGSNSFQQLGLCQRGFSYVNRPMLLCLPREETPSRISFGLRHCCVLTEENNVYIFGKLRETPVHPDIKLSRIPFNKTEIIKITTHLRINSIASGQNHVLLVVDNSSRMIGVGDNKFGQSNAFSSDEIVKHATCGWTHNGILTKSNEVFLWGRNSYGQIAQASPESCPTPQKLSLEDEYQPIQLHLGSEHGLVVARGGKVFTWGWNEHGNCGNGSADNLYAATFIDLPLPCKLAGTGAGFCYAICENA